MMMMMMILFCPLLYCRRSDIYTPESCENFGGFHVDGRCYYNSSHCPASYHSINAQCYQRSDARYSSSTCRRIGGYYHSDDDRSSNTSTTRAGTCYYNTFNCSAGFVVDQIACYVNRSATYRYQRSELTGIQM